MIKIAIITIFMTRAAPVVLVDGPQQSFSLLHSDYVATSPMELMRIILQDVSVSVCVVSMYVVGILIVGY